MRTNQKLKTGDIVEWIIVDRRGSYVDSTTNRRNARAVKEIYNHQYPNNAPHRIANTIITH